MDGFNSELMRGSLDLMVLSVLADGAKYGYLIQQQLRNASQKQVDLKAGTLYPVLHRLEADKYVRGKWDDSTGRRRKWYQLTAAGKKQLRSQAAQWQQYVDCIRTIMAPAVDLGTLPV